MRGCPVIIATALVLTGCAGTKVSLLDGEDTCLDAATQTPVKCATGSLAVLNDRTGGDIALIDQAYSRGSVRATRASFRNVEPEKIGRKHARLFDSVPKAPRKIILYFKKDTDELVAGSEKAIKLMFDEIRARPGADVEIVGHTSTTGDSQLNDTVSIERALKVKSLLAAAGLDEQVVAVGTAGRGERDPIDKIGIDNVESELNRRAEILIK